MRYLGKTKKLAKFAQDLFEHKPLEKGLPLIAKYAKEIVEAQRCSIFIVDNELQQLWTTLADGVERIAIPINKGIVGYTLKVKKPVITNDPYSHPEFLPEVDKETGFKTQNLASVPIFNSKREIIGVMQLLNKKEEFDDEDVRFMIFFAHYVSGYIELLNNILNEENK